MTDFVVSLRKTGLGDRVVCLCAAWIFARNTGRTLIVDWRKSIYSARTVLSTSHANLFPQCFDNRTDIAGVPLIAGPDLDTSRLPRPIHPARRDAGPIAAPWRVSGEGPPEERNGAVALIRSGGNIAAPTVVFDTCISGGVVAFADARAFLEALRPAAQIEMNIAAFWKSSLPRGRVIGLHIRHGNGGNILDHAKSWRSFEDAIDRCRLAIDEARRQLGTDAPVLLCTDSADVETAARKAIPGLVCRPKEYRRSGRGELHAGRKAAEGLEDALTEMLLLARCDVLIRYPAGSYFSFYAAVMKPRREPPPASVDELQAPWDPTDPLSPAIL